MIVVSAVIPFVGAQFPKEKTGCAGGQRRKEQNAEARDKGRDGTIIVEGKEILPERRTPERSSVPGLRIPLGEINEDCQLCAAYNIWRTRSSLA